MILCVGPEPPFGDDASGINQTRSGGCRIIRPRRGEASASSGVWPRLSAGTAPGQPAAGNPTTLKGERETISVRV